MNNYLASLNKKRTNESIELILKQAKERHTPIMLEDGINFLIQLIKIKGVKHVLEIGSAIGYSSIMMATFTDAHIFTIERQSEEFKLAVENIKHANLEEKITIVNVDALAYNLDEDYRCDLLFIDAAKAQYIKFLEKYEKYLNPKGIIITDNVLYHGFLENHDLIQSKNKRQLVRKINRFNEYLMNNDNYDTYIYEIGDGLSLSIKKGE